ncbi:MAG: BsuBI/PstI family type II restriction endonuclease [Gemmatimonadaceae bacterium]
MTFASTAAFTASHDAVSVAESIQAEIVRATRRSARATLGQFFTPAGVAEVLASLSEKRGAQLRMLDPGAGVGMLIAAWVSHVIRGDTAPEAIDVTAFEVDQHLQGSLNRVLETCHRACNDAGIRFSYSIRLEDFVSAAVEALSGGLFASEIVPFDCALLNPPYKKIRSDSVERTLLSGAGIETSNLYTAFVALSMRLLAERGELMAITPRSFCNGPYFRTFRGDLLGSNNLTHLHVLDSRSAAFGQDGVLQENVIFRVERGTPQRSQVSVEWSAGGTSEEIHRRNVAFDQVIQPTDPDNVIHITPDEWDTTVSRVVEKLSSSLAQLGLEVSTGRVVEFRAREHLRSVLGPESIPLIYPRHIYGQSVRWPHPRANKPNALALSPASAELTNPGGVYVVVKRFTAKEENRRLVAAVVTPDSVPGDRVAFENHVNYFHRAGRGIPKTLAVGLAAFLNSTIADRYFRQFSGHTQVNATDLRKLPYPSAAQLDSIATQMPIPSTTQEQLDDIVEEVIIAVKKPRKRGSKAIKARLVEASAALKALGLPKDQQNERAALTLLALLGMRSGDQWTAAKNPVRGVTPIMGFVAEHYDKHWKPNTRETIRRFTLHQFEAAGVVVANPDKPDRATNSPAYCYQVPPVVLRLLKTLGTSRWDANLRKYLAASDTLVARYARERDMRRLPLTLRDGLEISLSPGGQNELIRQIVEDFCPRFTPGGRALYVGDADKKWGYFDRDRLAELGVAVKAHGKMPDVVVHFEKMNWLVLVEAVTSHGPVNPKRRAELKKLFATSKAPLVFVTAFMTRQALKKFLGDIAWETEVWAADAPTHLIHFNGERFLGPYDS